MECYHQILLHLIFSVGENEIRLTTDQSESVRKNLDAEIRSTGDYLLALYVAKDHAHIFIKSNPDISLNELAENLKSALAECIHACNDPVNDVTWLDDFVAFTCSFSQIDQVTRFINNQEVYHMEKSFRQEMEDMLDMFEIPFRDDEFDWMKN